MSNSDSSTIQMVDLAGQYARLKPEIDAAMQAVITDTAFIKGPFVSEFECALAGALDVPYALGCANGTDALQIAFMALGVGPGDEVLTTPFTFVATGEAAALLGARATFADIDPRTFNLDAGALEAAITPRTKAIVPVHLYGQPCDMDAIMAVADRHGIPVVEDNAQGVGSEYKGKASGTIGAVGTLSFFPSKNLGAYGDGGGLTTRDEALYRRMKMIANHGSERKYHNEIVGINSRLDGLQAAILHVKLKHLDAFTQARRDAADRYDALLADATARPRCAEHVTVPYRAPDRLHVFHQYTVRIAPGAPGTRDGLAAHLDAEGIPSAIYYPVPLHRLPVFEDQAGSFPPLPESDRAAEEVLSLPMHTELTEAQQTRVADAMEAYFASANS